MRGKGEKYEERQLKLYHLKAHMETCYSKNVIKYIHIFLETQMESSNNMEDKDTASHLFPSNLTFIAKIGLILIELLAKGNTLETLKQMDFF